MGNCAVTQTRSSRRSMGQTASSDSGVTELHYYGVQGRGQQIRYTLAEGGIEWTDVSAPFPASDEVKQKWLALGGNLTTNVPMLVMGGQVYTQSSAVLRHAARKGGLMPTSDDAQYQVDNLIAAVDDYRTEAYKVIFPVLMGNPDAEALAQFKAVVLPKHFKNFERLLGTNDYFVNNQVSVADMTVFDIFTNFSFNLFPSTKRDYPKLVAFVERIASRRNMAKYLASEKYTSLMAFPCLE